MYGHTYILKSLALRPHERMRHMNGSTIESRVLSLYMYMYFCCFCLFVLSYSIVIIFDEEPLYDVFLCCCLSFLFYRLLINTLMCTLYMCVYLYHTYETFALARQAVKRQGSQSYCFLQNSYLFVWCDSRVFAGMRVLSSYMSFFCFFCIFYESLFVLLLCVFNDCFSAEVGGGVGVWWALWLPFYVSAHPHTYICMYIYIYRLYALSLCVCVYIYHLFIHAYIHTLFLCMHIHMDRVRAFYRIPKTI